MSRPHDDLPRDAEPLLRDVWLGRLPVVCQATDGTLQAEWKPQPAGVLCGSFNPLHQGHRELRAAAQRRLGGPVWYELSVTNADKPPLDFRTIDRRRRQFDEHPLLITSAPTFAEKAAALPGTVFVVGHDTAERILQPRFYGDDAGRMASALDALRRHGCRFLVAGRARGDRFCTRHDLDAPPAFIDLFEELPASEFRVDVSSTELRGGDSE